MFHCTFSMGCFRDVINLWKLSFSELVQPLFFLFYFFSWTYAVYVDIHIIHRCIIEKERDIHLNKMHITTPLQLLWHTQTPSFEVLTPVPRRKHCVFVFFYWKCLIKLPPFPTGRHQYGPRFKQELQKSLHCYIHPPVGRYPAWPSGPVSVKHQPGGHFLSGKISVVWTISRVEPHLKTNQKKSCFPKMSWEIDVALFTWSKSWEWYIVE